MMNILRLDEDYDSSINEREDSVADSLVSSPEWEPCDEDDMVFAA